MKRFVCIAILFAASAIPQVSFGGPTDGPISKADRIAAFSTNTWLIVCKGGEETTFELKGDGSSDLDILVLNSDGRLVAQTYGPGDRCKVTIKCPANTRVFVLLINRGPSDNNCTFSAR
jgi:hypothetical protein